MKKIRNLFVFIIMFLMIPNLVAAVGSCQPFGYRDYSVIVKNVNGAQTYQETFNDDKNVYEYKKGNFVIPYNQEVLVIRDVAQTEEDYFLSVLYGQQQYIVSVKDLKNKNSFKSAGINLKKTNYYMIKDTEVRVGPGILYEVAGVIKAGTNIQMANNNGFQDSSLGYVYDEGQWSYVSDGKISGYVFAIPCGSNILLSFGEKVENNDYYYVGENGKYDGLKYGDKIDVKYSLEDFSHNYYVVYPGHEVFLFNNEIGLKYDHKLIITNYEEMMFLQDSSGRALELKEYLKTNHPYKIEYILISGNPGYINYCLDIDNKKYVLSALATYNSTEYDYSLLVVDEQEKVQLVADRYYDFYTKDDSYDIIKAGQMLNVYQVLNASEDNVYYHLKKGFLYRFSSEDPKIGDDLIVNVVTEDETTDDNKIYNNELFNVIIMAAAVVLGVVLLNKNKKNKQ